MPLLNLFENLRINLDKTSMKTSLIVSLNLLKIFYKWLQAKTGFDLLFMIFLAHEKMQKLSFFVLKCLYRIFIFISTYEIYNTLQVHQPFSKPV